jgi:hypothetical protein
MLLVASFTVIDVKSATPFASITVDIISLYLIDCPGSNVSVYCSNAVLIFAFTESNEYPVSIVNPVILIFAVIGVTFTTVTVAPTGALPSPEPLVGSI